MRTDWLNLRIKEKIFDPQKIASLDYWRALAILFVVCWHFYPVSINFGLLGVQIFFVLSGFLVSRPLVRALLANDKVPWKRFFTARILRIFPSYFAFLLLGSLVCFLLFSSESIFIPMDHIWSYILLFKNYNVSNPRAFSHIWSLCVEEHFYLLLPPLFIFFALLRKPNLAVVILFIFALSQLLVRYIGSTNYFEQRGFFFSDPASTHNNFDGLLYGVLIRIAYEKGILVKHHITQVALFAVGLLILGVSVYFGTNSKHPHFYFIVFKTLNSMSIALIIWSALEFKASSLSWLRYLSFYSYNWYLWHAICVLAIRQYFGGGMLFFAFYLVLSLLVAIIATHLIELNAYKLFTRKSRAQN